MSDIPRDAELTALWGQLNPLTRPGPIPTDEPILQKIQARAEELEAAGNPEAVQHLAALYNRRGIVAASPQDAVAAYLTALPYALRALEHEPDVKCRDRLGSVHYNLANVYAELGKPAEAEAENLAALPYFEANATERHDETYYRNNVAQTRFNLGNACMELGRAEDAANWFRLARDIWDPLTKVAPEQTQYAHDLARCYFNLAYVVSQKSVTPEALETYPKAHEVWERLLRLSGENLDWRCDLARCYYNHALILANSSRAKEALAAIEKSLPHYDRLVELAPQQQYYRDIQNQARTKHEKWLSSMHPERLVTKQLAETEKQAAQARSTGDGKRLKQLGASLLDLASACCRVKKPSEMEQVYRAAIALVAESARLAPSVDAEHLDAAIYFDMNADLHALGRDDAAEEAARNALHRWTRLHATYPNEWRFFQWLAGARNHLGIIAMDTGRSAAAEAHYRHVLEMRGSVPPENAENQLYLGGTHCNLGNIYLDRNDLVTARDFYERGVALIEAVRDKLPGNKLLDQFLTNCKNGLAQCASRKSLKSPLRVMATACWTQSDPPALPPLDGVEPALAEWLRHVDDLRRANDPAAAQETAELVTTHPDIPEAWFLRGLVLAHFVGDDAGKVASWKDDDHEEAIAAFYQALVLRPDYYDAMLYKGLALQGAAHAALSSLRGWQAAVEKEKLPEEERKSWLEPRRTLFRCTVSRARESLQSAARMRPGEGRPWAEIVEMYREFGYDKEAGPYLEKLKEIDPAWWERIKGKS